MTLKLILDALIGLIQQIDAAITERDYPTLDDAAGLILMQESLEHTCERFSSMRLSVA